MEIEFKIAKMRVITAKVVKPYIHAPGEKPKYTLFGPIDPETQAALQATIVAWLKARNINPKTAKLPFKPDEKIEDQINVSASTLFRPTLLDANGVPMNVDAQGNLKPDEELIHVERGAVIRVAGAITFNKENKWVVLRPNFIQLLEQGQKAVVPADIWAEADVAASPPSTEGNVDTDDAFVIR